LWEINENNNSIHLIYGTDDERRVMQHYVEINSVWAISKTKYYTVNYDEEETNTNTRKIHYISGAYGLVAVYITSLNPVQPCRGLQTEQRTSNPHSSDI
jgi:hypothetical protein